MQKLPDTNRCNCKTLFIVDMIKSLTKSKKYAIHCSSESWESDESVSSNSGDSTILVNSHIYTNIHIYINIC